MKRPSLCGLVESKAALGCMLGISIMLFVAAHGRELLTSYMSEEGVCYTLIKQNSITVPHIVIELGIRLHVAERFYCMVYIVAGELFVLPVQNLLLFGLPCRQHLPFMRLF